MMRNINYAISDSDDKLTPRRLSRLFFAIGFPPVRAENSSMNVSIEKSRFSLILSRCNP
jgi:hypothetical protein